MHREVVLPAGFDYSVVEGPKDTPAGWASKGVKRADGLPWTSADQAAQAGLILPSGAAGPAFLVFPNHMAIRRYNNSTAYALGVGLLADRFGGSGPLVTPWPYEVPLSLADRVAAAMKLRLADRNVKAILVNLFGGITRGDEVARGLIEARDRKVA